MKRGFRILHIDDDENDRLFVARAFHHQHRPVTLTQVNDGQEARDFLLRLDVPEAAPHLILSASKCRG